MDQLKAEPSLVELNAPSLQALLNSNVEMMVLDVSIAKSGWWKLMEPTIEHCGSEVDRFAYFGINTAKELEDKTSKYYSVIERFARAWLSRSSQHDESNEVSGSIQKGIFIFYPCYVLAVLQSKPDAPVEYLEYFNIGSDYQGDAEQLVSIFQSVETAD
ncbi:hypothetical protein FVF58_27370 [Paraburkholderia panacisoli]|uniref:Uncharacterized protein n=1 Tax=Paraburkholderia panacisoli TaxID=2603818 RepID=A0A5B0GTP2_9BURK|nr:hypothetical protein [Paraburkholderia panacisoli]KAA1006295.1 hypothetical protein FVF58_27370 [Paraburkholderia panacisoli]